MWKRDLLIRTPTNEGKMIKDESHTKKTNSPKKPNKPVNNNTVVAQLTGAHLHIAVHAARVVKIPLKPLNLK